MLLLLRNRICLTKRILPIFIQYNNISTNNTSDLSNHYDIIITGGGMVGCTLAQTIANNPKLSSHRVLLLERNTHKQDTIFNNNTPYSNRVSALNPRTVSLMKKIGAWKHIIQDMRYKSVKTIQVWDGLSNAAISFDSDILNDSITYIVENDVLLNAVNRELYSDNNTIQVLNNVNIIHYDIDIYSSKISKIIIDDGTTYTCDLLVGADGASSAVRRAIDTEYISWSYQQMGVVATLTLADALQDTPNECAWQRFLPSGPIALLPLSSTQSSLVWSTEVQHAKDLVKMKEEDFVNAVNEAFCAEVKGQQAVRKMMGTMSNLIISAGLPTNSSCSKTQVPPRVSSVAHSSRAAFPLGFGHAVRYVSGGVALVGDAAHRVHPLAGQGVNLGFGDVETLVEILGESVYAGRPLNDRRVLLEYETRRQREVVMMSAAIDGLHRLYKSEWSPVVAARSIGLQLVDACPPLKRLLMQRAQS